MLWVPFLIIKLFVISTICSLQARSLCTFQMYPKGHHNTSSFRIGVVLWLVGAAINIHSDSILLNLRVEKRSNALKREYYIPQGGLFHYVSAANYFGEIIEWGGFALACQTKSAFAFWFFVCANLMPRAHSHHRCTRKSLMIIQ